MLIFILSFLSCTRDEEKTPFEAVGDVYYLNKMANNKKVSALSFYAYANKAMTTAVVSLANGGSITLSDQKENSFVRFKEPAENDFGTNIPMEGHYNFDLESKDGDRLTSTDVLKRENLGFPEILKITYEDVDYSYDVEWSEVNAADEYFIKLLDKNASIVFTSATIEKGSTAFTLIQDELGTWEKEIVVGSNYLLQVFAVAYDGDADATATVGSISSPPFNMQEISFSETEFIWDEQ